MNSSLSSNICDQNVNFFTKILCRSEMKATRSPAETAKYVIKAKLVSSLRDTILANFGLFRRQKNGFGVVYNKFLLPFHNRHILSCKKMQKKISLHIHFNSSIMQGEVGSLEPRAMFCNLVPTDFPFEKPWERGQLF